MVLPPIDWLIRVNEPENIKSQRLVVTYRKLRPFLRYGFEPGRKGLMFWESEAPELARPTFAEFCDHYQMDPDTGERRLTA